MVMFILEFLDKISPRFIELVTTVKLSELISSARFWTVVEVSINMASPCFIKDSDFLAILAPPWVLTIQPLFSKRTKSRLAVSRDTS